MTLFDRDFALILADAYHAGDPLAKLALLDYMGENDRRLFFCVGREVQYYEDLRSGGRVFRRYLSSEYLLEGFAVGDRLPPSRIEDAEVWVPGETAWATATLVYISSYDDHAISAMASGFSRQVDLEGRADRGPV